MYMYIHTYTHIILYTCMEFFICLYIHIFIPTRARTYTHPLDCTHIFEYFNIDICIYTFVYVQTLIY